jgi:hypothetical protein
MAAQRRPKKEAKRPEHSVTLKASEDSRPIGLMPPSFPPDHVAGSIAPFFLAGSYIGETPSHAQSGERGHHGLPDRLGAPRAEQRTQEDLHDGDDAGSDRIQIPGQDSTLL